MIFIHNFSSIYEVLSNSIERNQTVCQCSANMSVHIHTNSCGRDEGVQHTGTQNIHHHRFQRWVPYLCGSDFVIRW